MSDVFRNGYRKYRITVSKDQKYESYQVKK